MESERRNAWSQRATHRASGQAHQGSLPHPSALWHEKWPAIVTPSGVIEKGTAENVGSGDVATMSERKLPDSTILGSLSQNVACSPRSCSARRRVPRPPSLGTPAPQRLSLWGEGVKIRSCCVSRPRLEPPFFRILLVVGHPCLCSPTVQPLLAGEKRVKAEWENVYVWGVFGGLIGVYVIQGLFAPNTE
jgi:hypothetical protein